MTAGAGAEAATERGVSADAEPVVEVAARLRLAVGRLSRRLRQRGHGGLTTSQLSALASIERLGPLRLSELAAVESVAPPTLTRILAGLEGDGYVERAPDPADGRCSLVTASEPGRLALAAVRQHGTELLVRRLERLPAPELAALAAALPALESLAVDER